MKKLLPFLLSLCLLASCLPALGEETADAQALAYQEAMKLLAQGEYDDAYNEFARLVGYKDAAEKAYALSLRASYKLSRVSDTSAMYGYGGVYGLIDFGTDTVGPLQWQGWRMVGDDVLAVYRDGCWQLLHTDGTALFTGLWDGLLMLDDGLLVVHSADGYGLMRLDGTVLSAEQWQALGDYTDGTLTGEWTAPACGLLRVQDKDGLWGYIDLEGNVVIAPRFASAESFDEDGKAAVTRRDGSFDLIDTQGYGLFYADGAAWATAQEARYRAAERLLAADRAEEAASTFEALGSYRDAADRAAAIRAELMPSEEDAQEDAAVATEDGEVLIVRFGAYQQSADENDGRDRIEWYVLARQDGKALLMSRYVLDSKPFHTDLKRTGWADSSLRDWLNDTFYERAFTKEQRKGIVTRSLSNKASEGYESYSNSNAANTKDRVFLLSWAQAYTRYIQSDAIRETTPTAYALLRGAPEDGSWWLRSPGKHGYEAAAVGKNGKVKSLGVNTRCGLRPCIWVDLEQCAEVADQLTKGE